MKEFFEETKIEYENIKCDDDFKRRAKNIMKNQKRKHGIAIGTASVAALCMITLNTFSAIPIAAQGIPVVETIVNVITFGRFEMHDGGFDADIKTPKIDGLSDKKLEEKLNAEFKENADAIKAQFVEDVAEIKENFPDGAHMSISMDYDVKCNNDDYLSLDVYVFNAIGSSSTKHSYYNIDKKTNSAVTLDDLFKNVPNYREKIKNYVYSEMVRRNAEENGLFWLENDEFGWESAEKALDENEKFYIKPNGKIVVSFDKYEIAAGAEGCPEFELPDVLE